MPDDAEDKTSSHDEEDVGRIQAIADYSRERVRVASVDISARVRDFDAKKAVDAVLEAPKRLKREWQKPEQLVLSHVSRLQQLPCF